VGGANEAKAQRIRLMTDDVSGMLLWDDDVTEDLEDLLPLGPPSTTRQRPGPTTTRKPIGGVNPWWRKAELPEHGRRGYQLTLDLQAVLGPEYKVDYRLETSDLWREVGRSG
jgi:hypothetical protein